MRLYIELFKAIRFYSLIGGGYIIMILSAYVVFSTDRIDRLGVFFFFFLSAGSISNIAEYKILLVEKRAVFVGIYGDV